MMLQYVTFSRLLPVFRDAKSLEPKGDGGRPGLGHCAYSSDVAFTIINASGLNQTLRCNQLSFIPAGPTVCSTCVCYNMIKRQGY